MSKLILGIIIGLVLALPAAVYAMDSGLSHWEDQKAYYIDKYKEGTITCFVAVSHGASYKDPSISCTRNQ